MGDIEALSGKYGRLRHSEFGTEAGKQGSLAVS